MASALAALMFANSSLSGLYDTFLSSYLTITLNGEGLQMWFLVLKSGVHATLAGVITAFTIPLVDKFGKSPLHALENGLTPYVLYGIVPIFAFANAGVVMTGPLGIALGLIVGKQIGDLGTYLRCRMSGRYWLYHVTVHRRA